MSWEIVTLIGVIVICYTAFLCFGPTRKDDIDALRSELNVDLQMLEERERGFAINTDKRLDAIDGSIQSHREQLAKLSSDSAKVAKVADDTQKLVSQLNLATSFVPRSKRPGG